MDEASFECKNIVVAVDEVQVEWLARHFGQKKSEIDVYPMSLQAYAAVLKHAFRCSRAELHDEDFSSCDQLARKNVFEASRSWLRELGLDFSVAGINIAELDATCQFQLFLHCTSIYNKTVALLQVLPRDVNICILRRADPLPLDFYFDSDVGSAVIQYVVEKYQWKVRVLTMYGNLPEASFPEYPNRPVFLRDENRERCPVTKAERAPRYRVGILAATIYSPERYFDALRSSDFETVYFGSAWSPSLDSLLQSDSVCRLTVDAARWTESTEKQLRSLREKMSKRIGRSTLPKYIIDNPHLRFQWDYIITERWLGYAKMIHRGAEIVKSVPLDLFIHADHFTAEGAIFAELYRRKKTRIVIAPHSGWPVEPDWSLAHPSDIGLVSSDSSGRRLRSISGVSRILACGSELTRPYESLRTDSRISKARERLQGTSARKVVLLITSGLELNAVPLTALASHFRTLSVLSSVPQQLQDRVVVAMRPKPGRFGDKRELLCALGGYSRETLSLTEGLSFLECIRLADCAVGVNVATTGYFEVLEEGVPLLHVQTAGAACIHPDLPISVVPRVMEDEEIWPAIESLLFDIDYREAVRRKQRNFVLQDRKLQFEGDPIQSAIRSIQRSDFGWRVRSFGTILRRRSLQPGDTPESVGNTIYVKEDTTAGHVDDVLSLSRTGYVLMGWAVDLQQGQPAERVHAFVSGIHAGVCQPGMAREDVAAAYRNSGLINSGFRLPIRLSGPKELESVEVYAELKNNHLARLHCDLPLLHSVNLSVSTRFQDQP